MNNYVCFKLVFFHPYFCVLGYGAIWLGWCISVFLGEHKVYIFTVKYGSSIVLQNINIRLPDCIVS
jgi:hypothetical protein